MGEKRDMPSLTLHALKKAKEKKPTNVRYVGKERKFGCLRGNAEVAMIGYFLFLNARASITSDIFAHRRNFLDMYIIVLIIRYC